MLHEVLPRAQERDTTRDFPTHNNIHWKRRTAIDKLNSFGVYPHDRFDQLYGNLVVSAKMRVKDFRRRGPYRDVWEGNTLSESLMTRGIFKTNVEGSYVVEDHLVYDDLFKHVHIISMLHGIKPEELERILDKMKGLQKTPLFIGESN